MSARSSCAAESAIRRAHELLAAVRALAARVGRRPRRLGAFRCVVVCVAEIRRALEVWAPRALGPLPKDPGARAPVHELNDLCADTYCESDFLFGFEDLTCAASATACTLSFSSLHRSRRCIVDGRVSVPRATVRSAEAFGRAILQR